MWRKRRISCRTTYSGVHYRGKRDNRKSPLHAAWVHTRGIAEKWSVREVNRPILNQVRTFLSSILVLEYRPQSSPKAFGIDSVIAVNQNMAHSFNLPPVYFCVSVAGIRREHIYGFADYLNKLRETIEYQFVAAYVFKSVLSMEFFYAFNGFEDVFQSSFVLNFLSHKSKLCPGSPIPSQKAKGDHIQLSQLCDEEYLPNRA